MQATSESRLVESNFHSCLKPDSMPEVWFRGWRSVTAALSFGQSGKKR
jgi:hypothetical protein